MILLFLMMAAPGEQAIRGMLTARTGTVKLPAGKFEISSELRLPAGAHDLTIDGAGATLHASAKFTGRALLSCRACRNIGIRNLAIDGNRAALEKPVPLAPPDLPFSQFYANNGILIEETDGLSIEHVDFDNVTNFAILVSQSKHVFLDHISVQNSGSRNAKGRNNTSGGILLEQGTEDFTVADSTFRAIRGNAVWTHSRFRSPRNARGKIANNQFSDIGRDAIQVGHATEILVTGNTGRRIGFHLEETDLENGGTPVGIDTSGNVDRSTYEYNRFEEVNGKCIDLDGFHDGAVRHNVCLNRGKVEDYPYGNFGISINNSSVEMRSQNILIEDNQIEGTKYGALFVVGVGHKILRNQMRRLNLSHCNESHPKIDCHVVPGEPEFLESGIYLAKRAEKADPVHGVTIQDNEISGWKMGTRCIEAAPGVRLTDNNIRGNRCKDE